MVNDPKDGPPTHNLDSLWNDIAAIRIGMVTTCDAGVLRSRPVLTSPEREEEVVYFFTRAEDHKIREIGRDGRVCVAFVDSGREIYISVSGEARILDDRDRARKYASPEAIAWFDNGIDDESLRLIRVGLQQAERWDVNANPIRKTWEIVRSMNSPRTPELADNSKFSFRS
jgi:general stress protein 26